VKSVCTSVVIASRTLPCGSLRYLGMSCLGCANAGNAQQIVLTIFVTNQPRRLIEAMALRKSRVCEHIERRPLLLLAQAILGHFALLSLPFFSLCDRTAEVLMLSRVCGVLERD
jgi:hypothetical protein